MFTGQLIGYVGQTHVQTRVVKDFISLFHQSLKELETLKTRLFG